MVQQDCQFNYYGNKLAVCDSEGSIEIHHLDGSKGKDSKPISLDLGNQSEDGMRKIHNNSHDGPIWQVAWAEPE